MKTTLKKITLDWKNKPLTLWKVRWKTDSASFVNKGYALNAAKKIKHSKPGEIVAAHQIPKARGMW
jgi:hypothetical protein